MKKDIPYTYVLLRYRHDPLSGEFVNVGVVLHSFPARYLGARVRKTIGRLSKMFPDIDKSHLTMALQAIERSVLKLRQSLDDGLLSSMSKPSDAATLAGQAMPPDDSSFVWGDLRSGITDDPERVLDKLYKRFVAVYDEEGRVSRDDAAVWQPVRERLLAKCLLDRLQPKTIISPVDEVDFDSAWKNGVWHCYQALSFDLASPDSIREKAARWSGHMLGASKSSEPIQPHFIVGAPANPDLFRHYLRAIELIKASPLNPDVHEESDVDSFVNQIEDEIRAHDASIA